MFVGVDRLKGDLTLSDQDKLSLLDALSNAAWLALAEREPNAFAIAEQERAIRCLEIIKSTFQIRRGLERVE
jgi:hypothetical protein